MHYIKYTILCVINCIVIFIYIYTIYYINIVILYPTFKKKHTAGIACDFMDIKSGDGPAAGPQISPAWDQDHCKTSDDGRRRLVGEKQFNTIKNQSGW